MQIPITALKRTLLELIALITVALIIALSFPGPIIEAVAKMAAKKPPIKISQINVSGNLFSGLTVQNLKMSVPQAHVSVDRIHISVLWSKLLRRTVAIDNLEIDRPAIQLVPLTKEKNEEPKGTKSAWSVTANHVRISDGRLRMPADGDRPAMDVERVNATLHYLSLADANARVRATIRQGPRLEADFNSTHEGAHWNARVTGGGIHAKTTGRYDASSKKLTAAWDAAVSSNTVRQWTKAQQTELTSSGHANGRWPDLKWNTQLTFSNLRLNEAQVATGSMVASGQGASHKIRLSIATTDYSLFAAGTGSYENSQWTMRWSRFDLQAIQNWRLVKPFETLVGARNVQVNGFHAADRSTHAHFDLAISSHAIERCDIKANGFELGNLSNMKLVSFPLRGVTEVNIHASGPLKSSTGKADLKIKGLEIDGAAVGEVDAQARFTSEALHLERLRLKTADGQAVVAGSVKFPSKTTKTPQFDLKIVSTNLDPAPLLKRTGIETQSARVNADVQLKKSGALLMMNGPIHLTAERIDAAKAGLHLENVAFKLVGTGSTLKITEGTAATKKNGQLTVNGSINESRLDVKLHAKNFAFDNTAGISGRTDADLSILGTVDEPRINGDVNVLQANIMPPKKDKKKQKETKKKTAEELAQTPSALDMRLRVHFDRNVWYKEKQTAIEAKGDLEIKKQAYAPILIAGDIQTIRGTYIFYGRAFKIDRGRVLFTGEPDLNPTIDLQAVYTEKQSKTAITLSATGTLNDPRLSLTSDPPLEQTDIVSVLVTGHPMDDPNQSSDSNAQAAAKATIANYFAEQIRERVQSTAAIDVLQFNMKDADTADLTVGKNISDRLYVAYGQTLGSEGQQRIEAEYLLGHFWSLAGTTATEGKYVIDLIYRLGLR